MKKLTTFLILGNMWSQSWENIVDIIQPFKNKTSVDVTPALKKQV